MTNKEILEKQKNGDIIGYWAGYDGIEVVDIEYGINDKCLCVTNVSTNNPKAHKVKIHYIGEDPHIVLYGKRYNFSNCLRKNI